MKSKDKGLTAEELIKKRRNAIYRKRWRENHPYEYRTYMRNYMRKYNAKKRERTPLQRLADFFKRLWR